MDQNKRYLNVKEVGEYIGISRWTIYDLVKNRSIPHIKISKQALRFDRLRVDKWMQGREVKTVREFISEST